MYAPLIGLVSPLTVIATLMFDRVESNVTVAFPHPVLVVGVGRSCGPVITTPYVCACTTAAANRNTTAARPIRRFITPPPSIRDGDFMQEECFINGKLVKFR